MVESTQNTGSIKHDRHHVDAPHSLLPTGSRQVRLGQPLQPPDLDRTDRLLGNPIETTESRLHLHEYYFGPVFGHDIKLAEAASVVAGQQTVSLTDEMLDGQLLTPSAERPRIKHQAGASRARIGAKLRRCCGVRPWAAKARAC